MIRTFFKSILLSLFVLSFVACAQSPLGVFESIQLERRIVDDRALGNDLIVGAMDIAAGRYFISAATVWYRDTSDADYPNDVAQWTSLTSPGSSNFTSSSLVTFDGSGSPRVYAVFTSQDATAAGLYSIDPAGDLQAVAAGDLVFGTDDSNVSGLGKVFVVDDGTPSLAVSVKKPGTSSYSVYLSTTGASGSFAEIDGTDATLTVIDTAFSTTGEVFFLTRKAILVDADGLNTGTAAEPVAGNPVTGGRQPEFGGIFFDSDSGTLWVTDNEGYLYRSTDLGATWSSNAEAHQVSTSDDSALSFTDMTAVDQNGTRLLLVGTDEHGYRQLTADFVPTTPDASGSNYQASELAQATVLTFFVDPGTTTFVPAESGNTFEEKTGDLLFAGTSNLGLWKALFTDTEPQWVRE